MHAQLASPPEYASYIENLRGYSAELAGDFAEFHGIDQVLGSMERHGLQQAASDTVVRMNSSTISRSNSSREADRWRLA